MQSKTTSKGIIQWVLTSFSIISQNSQIRVPGREHYRQNEVSLKKALNILHVYLLEYSWALQPVLFILAQEVDVMHDVWWQTVLIFSVRVLILIYDHGLHFFL